MAADIALAEQLIELGNQIADELERISGNFGLFTNQDIAELKCRFTDIKNKIKKNGNNTDQPGQCG